MHGKLRRPAGVPSANGVVHLHRAASRFRRFSRLRPISKEFVGLDDEQRNALGLGVSHPSRNGSHFKFPLAPEPSIAFTLLRLGRPCCPVCSRAKLCLPGNVRARALFQCCWSRVGCASTGATNNMADHKTVTRPGTWDNQELRSSAAFLAGSSPEMTILDPPRSSCSRRWLFKVEADCVARPQP